MYRPLLVGSGTYVLFKYIQSTTFSHSYVKLQLCTTLHVLLRVQLSTDNRAPEVDEDEAFDDEGDDEQDQFFHVSFL